MKCLLAALICWSLVQLVSVSAEPTESRLWRAQSGHELEAVCLKVSSGKAHFRSTQGKVIVVPLGKLVQEDQDRLAEHFKLKGSGGAGAVSAPAEGESADDLPHPLGKTTAEISCEGGFSYFLYFPQSLRKGEKHPVLYIMSPGGGSPKVAKRYIQGAERNRWILAVSKQSKNGFEKSSQAIEAMMDHVQSSLPIDKERIYATGFSGGSRMASWAAQNRKEIVGLISCGASGEVGSRKQVVYGLCGSNCFNRSDMAHALKSVSHKGSVLRYFTGRHVWANAELCDDAMTHLNGVFLSSNKSDYADEYAHYTYQLGSLIEESRESHPMRAYMWAEFAKEYDFNDPRASKAYTDLGKDPLNPLYVKGLKDIRKLAEKTFGKISASQWKSDPKVSAACKREAEKYVGTPWEEVLNKMSEDAQKF